MMPTQMVTAKRTSHPTRTACTAWIGTSGYSFYCWEGALYRPGVTAGEMLPCYAGQFDTVELNYSFYRLPTVKTSAAMVKKTPPGFTFFAKINQEISHRQDLSGVSRFKEGLQPLRAAGKLSGLLLQFPQACHNTSQNRNYLIQVLHHFAEYRVAVEFRHRSWLNSAINQYLHDHNVSLVSVDVPPIQALYPRTQITTADFAYVRLHSRNAERWYGSGEERYDYNYSEAELREWLPVLGAFSARVKNVFVFFNNCHRGQAAENAKAMKKIIENSGLNLQAPAVDRSPMSLPNSLWSAANQKTPTSLRRG